MKARHNQGFTLLEVLVAVLVLSIGLLGMASLQVAAMRYGHGAHMRTIAMYSANEMADRLRANKAAVNNNNYANVALEDPENPGDPEDPGDDCQDSNSRCSPAEMATVDIFQWKQVLGQLLPKGDGRVVCNDSDTGDADTCTDGSTHTIEVVWEEPFGEDDEGQLQVFQNSADGTIYSFQQFVDAINNGSVNCTDPDIVGSCFAITLAP